MAVGVLTACMYTLFPCVDEPVGKPTPGGCLWNSTTKPVLLLYEVLTLLWIFIGEGKDSSRRRVRVKGGGLGCLCRTGIHTRARV